MKTRIIAFIMVLANMNISNAQPLNIIPAPYSETKGNGTYHLAKNISISNHGASAELVNEIANELKLATAKEVRIGGKIGAIVLSIVNEETIGKEGYFLEVNEKGIQIKANTNAGLFYGWQTVKQIMPAAIYSNKNNDVIDWSLPYVKIMDKPRFGWRGLMLDVSRHFFSKADVKIFIDDMARYKYNRFHWHLTDDQGWRIEIKSLPKLTEVGAWRPERKGKWMNTTTPSVTEPKTYGGYYTQEDLKEIVAYAKSKFIEVIPEIDIPGHSLAMITAYPQLSTTPNYPYQVNVGEEFMDWEGINGHATAKIDNALDPSNELVYQYLDQIFGEIAPLFPFEYIHMGGDEIAKNNWEKSANVHALMKKEGLKNQNEVQSYFVRRVQKIINNKGKKMIGWDEILEGGLSGDAAVMSWRGIEGGINAAKQGHKVVMSPNGYNYLDFYQGEITAEGKVYAGLRMKKTYSFEPIPAGIDSNLILGNQGNQWTEQLQTMRNVQYMTWPRALAIAETSWSPKSKKSWPNFVEKVEGQFEKLAAANVKFAVSMYDPIVTTQLNTKGELIVNMEGEIDGLKIYYSIDDSMPDQFSDEYTKPFVVPEDVSVLRVISYRNNKPLGKMLSIPMESLKRRATKVL
jgi:hexosaminidase